MLDQITSVDIREQCHIQEQQQLDPQGHAVRVTVIQGGRSANDYSYNEQVLQAIARMIEGAQAYADHGPPDVATRSVRDIVGFYHDACYIPPSATCPGGRVDATLHILEAAGWLWSMIYEACTLGRPELIGLSIDIFGQWQLDEATSAREVTRIIALNSCDIVTRPSAGGSFNRILHSQHLTSKNSILKGTAMTTADEQQTLDPTTQERVNHVLEQQCLLEQQRLQLEQLMAQARLEHAGLVLERRLQESILPQAVKDEIKARYTGRIFEEKDLDAELNSSLNMMAKLAQDGLIRGHSYEKVEIGSQITEAEKIQASLSGGMTNYSKLGNIRVSESAPIMRITEADTTTASFSYLLGTSMNKRLLKDYQAWPAEWQKWVTIVPIRDFKQQTRVRLGAFGSLPIVAEDTAYQAVTLTDSAATYVAQKRGNLVTVSRETIINDDLQAIKQIPTKLAVAAAYTLAEFVYGFLSSNPGIYDGNNLFTAGAPHNNLGSSALSTAAMQTGITAMREQTNYAGKRLGLRPRFLVVPPELEWTAIVATKSAGVPGSNNNDINPMLGFVSVIVSPQLTSTTQWFLVDDPREIDTIEIGFVGGAANPVLFVQDSPLLGLNFSQDAISYKVRMEWGGAVVDYRGLYRGI